MKKKFKLEDLDCANCAAKMEEAIAKLPGVKSASVSFIMAELTLECEEADFPAVLKQAAKAIRKIEPDCRLIV